MDNERDPLITEIIGCAIEVHEALGPGLLESSYRPCLGHEFRLRGLKHVSELALPLVYQGVQQECGYRLDFVGEERVVVELKSVDRLLPVHTAQVITYLKLLKQRRGPILNFNVVLLKHGVRSITLKGDLYEVDGSAPQASPG